MTYFLKGEIAEEAKTTRNTNIIIGKREMLIKIPSLRSKPKNNLRLPANIHDTTPPDTKNVKTLNKINDHAALGFLNGHNNARKKNPSQLITKPQKNSQNTKRKFSPLDKIGRTVTRLIQKEGYLLAQGQLNPSRASRSEVVEEGDAQARAERLHRREGYAKDQGGNEEEKGGDEGKRGSGHRKEGGSSRKHQSGGRLAMIIFTLSALVFRFICFLLF